MAIFREPGQRSKRPIDFQRINQAALPVLMGLCQRWLPGGQVRGCEYVALNPRRADRKAGSFSINLSTGRWADFSSGDKGGDPISLAAYLHGLSQGEAARELAVMLGVSDG